MGGPLLALPAVEATGLPDAGENVALGDCGYMAEPKESGLLVPPRAGDAGARLGKYSLIGLDPGAVRSPMGVPDMRLGLAGVPADCCWAFFRGFRFLSVGVLALVTGFSGLGSRIIPSPEFADPVESSRVKDMGLGPVDIMPDI